MSIISFMHKLAQEVSYIEKLSDEGILLNLQPSPSFETILKRIYEAGNAIDRIGEAGIMFPFGRLQRPKDYVVNRIIMPNVFRDIEDRRIITIPDVFRNVRSIKTYPNIVKPEMKIPTDRVTSANQIAKDPSNVTKAIVKVLKEDAPRVVPTVPTVKPTSRWLLPLSAGGLLAGLGIGGGYYLGKKRKK